MRSIAFADFLIGVGILFVLEGLMFAASPAWMRRAMKSALATPDNILRDRRHRLGGRGSGPDLVRAAVGIHRHSRDGPKDVETRNLEISDVQLHTEFASRPGMTAINGRK